MRWKIETQTNIDNDKEEEIRTTNRTLTISVGDIVGMGKSAAGAVQNLAKSLPQFVEKLKNIPKEAESIAKSQAYGIGQKAVDTSKAAASAAIAEGLNYIVQPLSVIIEGMEKYKSIMKVIDIITPIAKTIARTTGVWCSPGNVADLAQMALGIGQQLLIAIATSALLNLKEQVWNYEFDLYTISSSTSRKISVLLKKFDDENRLPKTIARNTSTEKLNNDPIITSIKNSVVNHYNKDGLDGRPHQGLPSTTLPSSNEVGGGSSPDELSRYELELAKSNGWKTQKQILGRNYTRILYGSLMGNGIIYSDDNGETWERSSQKDKSFSKFAKIMVNGKWRYISGSTYYIKEITPTIDEEIGKDSKNHYNKDYYNFDKNGNIYKLSKRDKDKLLKDSNFSKLKDIFNDRKDFEYPVGIMYSDDDGETWNKTDILSGSFEKFFEAPEKVDCPARLIASSYDYEGLRYSDNGINWHYSDFKYTETKRELNPETGKEEPIEKDITTQIDNGRWTYFVGMDGRMLAKTNSNNCRYDSTIDNPLIIAIAPINEVEQPPTTFARSRMIRSAKIKETKQINMNIDLSVDRYNLLDEDGLKIDMEITGPIIKYIHDNYPDRIPKYSENFWYNKIRAINTGAYTINDARAGKELETDYNV